MCVCLCVWQDFIFSISRTPLLNIGYKFDRSSATSYTSNVSTSLNFVFRLHLVFDHFRSSVGVLVVVVVAIMKSYSRKMAPVKIGSQFSASTASTGPPSTAGNTVASAAAVSVTKFGQATFTSVRRKEYENGQQAYNFVPLKKTVSEDAATSVKTEEKPAPKPKVYKFFKSRSDGPTNPASANAGAPTSVNSPAHPSPPKPLMLNSNTKEGAVKQITATFAKHGGKTGRNECTVKTAAEDEAASKTITLSDQKSCEIKVCGDKTIKRVISPNKTTHFVIKNNTGVRGATLKAVSTPSNVHSISRGVRASRRLKGIEPEAVRAARKSQTIHLSFNKDKPKDRDNSVIDFWKNHDEENSAVVNDEANNITTLIESVDEDSKEVLPSNDDDIPHCDDIEQSPSSIPLDEKCEIDKLTNAPEEEEKVKCADKSETIDASHEVNKNNIIDKIDNIDLELPINNNVSSQPLSQQSSQPSSQLSLFSETDSQPAKAAEGEQNNENKSIPVRPKKKIFSNRDRNKVEFNTKSFFVSSTKDEFDMELDDNKSAEKATQGKSDNKNNGHDNEEDDQYIKLKRIKKAHQCHDLGETEQFDEDIKYYLSGIVSSNPKSMRCLSILGLSQQAMRPEFRMHLRAHDDMPRIIKALMDAPQDPHLALCTATLMFVYNQDRLTMDIDPNALSLMLDLLETRSDECNPIEEKHRLKVVSLVEEMQGKGFAKYLKLTEITAGKLAMETLLGLTSKRAGDWFKVELRKMKGIDFIVNTVLRCAENFSEEGQMIKIDRCMHVLENVTFNNVENQQYITDYNESKFISTCIQLLENCKFKIISSNDSKVFLSAFFSILRVLTNLTSESVDGCKVVGSFDGIMELLLESVFELPTFILSDQRFDLMVIILCLCINLVEFCEQIRKMIIETPKYMNRLTEFLFKKIEEAAQVEHQTDQMLESHEKVQMTEAMQDNLLMQMISKSGTHMEHSLLSACVCLLFGCCIQDNEVYMNLLKDALPNHSFDPLIEMLAKLRDFAHLADIMTQKGKDRVQRVLQIFRMYK